MAGRRLADRYELEEVVARGGMGVVWRGRDLRLDRTVAVKLVSGEALTDPTMVERFDREARIVARLNHPNIVAVYDFGADGGDSYLVMELVAGRSLAAVIADGPLSVGDAVAVAAQACAGLAAAHAAGVVHRDVKPANLIRTPAGVVKVCDFGIAHLQHAAGQARLTGTAIAMGSTSYMAPEQVNGEPVDARTDLYGLGCTIHALLTGAPPFVGGTPLAVVHQHVTASPLDVRVARPDVPGPLARLVAELLAKSPADRPSDAEAVAARLAAIVPASLRDEAPGAEPVAVGPPVERPPRWRRWGIAAGGAGALAATVLVSLLAATRDGDPASVTAPPPASAEGVSAPAPGDARSPVTPTAGPTRTTTAPTPALSTPPPATEVPTRTATPAPPADPVADLHRIIDEQVVAGGLKDKEADDLRKRVDDIDRRLASDDPETEKKIGELRTRLLDLRRQEKLTEAGYAAMSRAVDRLAAAAGA